MRTVNVIDSRGKLLFLSFRRAWEEHRVRKVSDVRSDFLRSECIFVTIALFVTEAFLCNGPFGGM